MDVVISKSVDLSRAPSARGQRCLKLVSGKINGTGADNKNGNHDGKQIDPPELMSDV